MFFSLRRCFHSADGRHRFTQASTHTSFSNKREREKIETWRTTTTAKKRATDSKRYRSPRVWNKLNGWPGRQQQQQQQISIRWNENGRHWVAQKPFTYLLFLFHSIDHERTAKTDGLSNTQKPLTPLSANRVTSSLNRNVSNWKASRTILSMTRFQRLPNGRQSGANILHVPSDYFWLFLMASFYISSSLLYFILLSIPFGSYYIFVLLHLVRRRDHVRLFQLSGRRSLQAAPFRVIGRPPTRIVSTAHTRLFLFFLRRILFSFLPICRLFLYSAHLPLIPGRKKQTFATVGSYGNVPSFNPAVVIGEFISMTICFPAEFSLEPSMWQSELFLRLFHSRLVDHLDVFTEIVVS